MAAAGGDRRITGLAQPPSTHSRLPSTLLSGDAENQRVAAAHPCHALPDTLQRQPLPSPAPTSRCSRRRARPRHPPCEPSASKVSFSILSHVQLLDAHKVKLFYSSVRSEQITLLEACSVQACTRSAKARVQSNSAPSLLMYLVLVM